MLLLIDNMSAVIGVGKSFSGTPAMLGVLTCIRREVSKFFIHLRARFVLSVRNPVADKLSHNDIAQAKCAAMEMFRLELIVQ